MNTSSSEKTVLEIDQTIRDAIQNLNQIDRLHNSPLLDSALVRQRQAEGQVPNYEALRAVLDEILFELHQQNPHYADLLRGRFWEGNQVKKMVLAQRPASWSESNFYNHQSRALQQFALIFKEREALASELEDAPAPIPPPDNRRNEDLLNDSSPNLANGASETLSPTVINVTQSSPPPLSALLREFFVSLPQSMVVSSALFLLAVIALIWLFTSYRLESNRSFATAGETEDVVGSVCGEQQRMEVVAQGDRFLASEGVSLFTVENTPDGVLSNFVRAVEFDATGLWLGYHALDGVPGGMSHFNKATWVNCNREEQLSDKNVNAVAHDGQGRLWLAAEQTGGVMMFDGTTWHRFTVADGLPTNDTFSITVDDENNVWIGTYQGVAKYDGRRWTVPYSQANQTVFSNHVHAVTFDREGGIWIGHHDAGISYLAAGSTEWQHLTAQQELGSDHVRSILAMSTDGGPDSSIWVATLGGGVTHFDGSQWVTYTTADGLPSNDIYDLDEDKYGRVWAATGAGVAYREAGKWQIYHRLPATTIAFSAINCAPCAYDDDHVVTGTFDRGFTHSRLPYPTAAIDVIQTCFFVNEKRNTDPSEPRTETCANPQRLTENHYRVNYPEMLSPNDEIRLEITVQPFSPYQLRADRGDFLANQVDDEAARFGAYKLMPVNGTVESGQPFIFTSYDDPLHIPVLEASVPYSITSSWRIWMHTRYTGPMLDIVLPVSP